MIVCISCCCNKKIDDDNALLILIPYKRHCNAVLANKHTKYIITCLKFYCTLRDIQVIEHSVEFK